MDSQSDTFLSTQNTSDDSTGENKITYRDPLTFDLPDDTFLEYAKQLKKDADNVWNTKGQDGLTLADRRKRNAQFLFGRQFAGQKRKKYSSTAQDNILWEASKYLRAMATSKLPDITVTPGSDSDVAKKVADEISKVVTSDIQKRERKRVLGLAFEHVPPYLAGIIKCFWNPQKGKYGDYDFRVVHPDLVTLDNRAATNDVRDMTFIFELCEYSVKELVMMFPDKEQELYRELRKQSVFNEDNKNEKNQRGMNTKVKIQEVWFKWYDQPTGDKKEWEEVIGVAWYYEGLLFKKIKHPYWDWSGTPQTFQIEYKELDGNSKLYSQEKTPLPEDVMRQSLLNGQPVENTRTETIFHNHLDYPEFPYIILGANQWGISPLDETSDLEQSIPMQQDYDKRSRQVDEIIDRSRGKNVWAINEGMTKDDIADLDPNDPDQDIVVKGEVNKVHAFIPGEQPSPALMEDKNSARERIFDKRGVHQATRGMVNSNTAATNNQIAREGDFTRMDDYVDDTINYAAEKMANWIMQFIKLFYTETHMRRVLGEDGKWVTAQIKRDLLDDGMEVIISASGSDKLKAEQRAMDMAKMKLIDPLKFYKDIGASDPRGRAVALMTFLMQPDLYLQDVKSGGDGSGSAGVQASANIVDGQVAQGVQPQPPGQGDGQSPQAMQDIMQIQQGQIPPLPQQIDPAYAQTFTAFMHSPELEQLLAQRPELKDPLLQFAQAIAQLAQGQAQQTVGQQPQTPPTPGEQFGGGGQSPVGPLAQNPSPDNTSRIAL